MRDTNEKRDILIREFVENYMEKLFYFCLKKTGSSTEAEDLTQDIALNIFTALDNGTVPTSFSAWVWKIARNRYSVWANEKHKHYESVTGSDIDDYEIEDDIISALDGIVYTEQLALLRRELAFIKRIYRDIVVAYYIEDKSIRNIASSMSLSESAVEQRLFRARKILKEGMDMAREFGKMSYKPENLNFTMNGLCGNNGEPLCYLGKSLDKNILLAAYRTPSTAEELATELGVALPYMEEELKTLVDSTLLVKRNEKYETDFYIFSSLTQAKIYSRYREIGPELTDKLIEICNIKNSWLDKNCPGWRSGYQSAEDMRWSDLMSVLDSVNSQAISKVNKNQFAENIGSWGHTIRPNGGEWDILGFEDCKDAPYGTSLCGCVDAPEVRNLAEINFRHYTFRVLGQQYFNQAITYREGQNLLNIVAGKREQTEKSIVDSLIKKGFLKQDKDEIIPTFCVIQKAKADNISAGARKQIQEKIDAAVQQIIPFYQYAVDCISAEIPQFISNKDYQIKSAATGILWGRGIIVEEAMKNGYLQVPEEEAKIKTLGASLIV